MTLNVEKVTILMNGAPFALWKSVTVQASAKQAVRAFAIESAEASSPIGAFNSVRLGTAVQILANGQLILDGFVNRRAPSGSKDRHQVALSGRSKSQDYVDSAAMHETGEWENADPIQIAQELARPYGINITSRIPLERVESFRLYPGEGAFNAIERLLRDQGVTQIGLPNGDVEVTNADAAKRHAGALIEGVNIKEYAGEISDDRRHSETIVRGQRRVGSGEANLRIEERHRDGGVTRNRPRVIIPETDTNPARARRRGRHDANRRRGFSNRATIKTQGWRDDGGTLWTPNYLVFVQAPTFLDINGDMLIETAKVTQTKSGGSETSLGLVHPSAYQGQAGRASETDEEWGADENE